MMRADLIKDIQTAIGSLSAKSPQLASRASVDKLYELFILSLVVKALKGVGATLSARDGNDNNTNVLQFRLAPGLLHSPATSPGFIHVSYQGNEYEIQNGLRVCGTSKVLHELDVSVLERREAQVCRQNHTNPRQSKIKFLAECKYYGTPLPLSLGREYLGLNSEFRGRVKTLASNQVSVAIQQLINSHRGTVSFNLDPKEVQALDIFVKWLSKELMQVL